MARCGEDSQSQAGRPGCRHDARTMPADIRRVIHVEPLAPSKPAEGAPCNGCGVCCLAEPCPAGVLITGTRSGPCRLLRWDEADRRYRCGLVGGSPEAPSGRWDRLRAAAARRWIGAGTGCDCSLEAAPPPGGTAA